ncbi:response regulator transcription factor [Paenibacillus abyssi]|uniref:DNA-binding response regulator n=1 Tax=Paenibacillus abyssi TaxID=1340531 RepID=A0A917CW43_9BACL|nr:response regulator [Paenibacillus abyssi]GGG00309.1 DNA-binding response regulator [Paenibacillus abyssi]
MYSIALVEDEKWVRTAISKVIGKIGPPFKVVMEATQGVEALDWLQLNRADIVLTDIRMPVMDGLSLMKEIRDRDIPADVIIVSGYDDFKYAQQALRLGAFDFLLKPLEKADLEGALQKWLERGKPKIGNTDELELSTIEKVIRFIQHSMPGEVSLKDAAAHVYLNPSYLSKLFKQEAHKNFVEFVTETRMREAGKMLSGTSLRISEVAERLGYTDISYFTNTFKKHFGITPSEYRKMKRPIMRIP